MINTVLFVWLGLLILALPVNLAFAQQFTGRLEWLHKVELRTLENAVIQRVNVNIGQQVKKGSLLISMDQREFKAAVEKSKAQLERANLDLSDAKDELGRAEELFERGLIAEEELKDAKIKHSAAIAEVESAKASLTLSEIAMERTEIRAPISGIITEKNAWEGTIVYKTLQQKPLISVAPYGIMLARALVHSNVLKQYKVGQTAKVNINGKLYNGKIYSLGLEAIRIEANGAVYELDVVFNYPSNVTLRPSETVKIIIP